ncbi:MAG: ABC transporter ATP-binding protein/permease [Clostridiaceae bacterium]|nr:ABC transporter ATP-binding protein/permease [Clostridiaceae bacterium]
MNTEKMSLKEMIGINTRGLRFIARDKIRGVFLMLFIGVINAIYVFWNVWLLAVLADAVQAHASAQILVRDLAIMAGGGLLVGVVKFTSDYILFYIGSNVWEHADMALNSKIMDMDYEYMESEKVQNQRRDLDEMMRTWNGGGINFLFWRVEVVVRTTAEVLISVVYLVQMIYKSMTVPEGNSMGMFLITLLFMVVFAGVLIFSYRQNIHWQEECFSLENDMIPVNRSFTWYVENYLEKAENAKNIRIFRQQPILMERIRDLFAAFSEKVGRICEIDEKIQFFLGVMRAVLLGFVYFLLGVIALKGGMTAGDVVLYAGAIGILIEYFSEWVFTFTELATNTKYLKAFFDFLDIPNRKYEGTLHTEKRDDDRFEVEFRHVSFHYPGSSQDVLKDFSIRFRIGERLAVVGENGSGKTTFIKLLCRLYDPTEGEILLNGIDIRKYDYQEYLQLFGVVFQDFKLLSMPLGQNIAASEHFSAARVYSALARMGMSDYAARLEQGLDTILYKDFDSAGIEVSGGEAQKFAMARALYRDAPFLILDEPTAALDPVAEYEVYSKFDALVGSKTAVYISHRLSSCRFCNDILVISDGRAVQRGSHEELLADEAGLYYRLWSAQAQYYR